VSEPLREQVLVTIIAALKTMTGDRLGDDGLPWGQYPSDPIVKRGFIDESLVNEFPALFVARRSGTSSKIETSVSGSVGIERFFLVDIYGFTKTANNVHAGTWLERLQDDVETTLRADAALAALTKVILFDAEDDYDEDDIKAGFRMGITFVLYESKVMA
jgi:hypothetical protein